MREKLQWRSLGTGLLACADTICIARRAARIAVTCDVWTAELARVCLRCAPERTKVWLASPEAAQ
eukprot:210927-Pyramimonas_sp.AAC.1